MAKSKRRRRNNKNFVAIPFTDAITLGTLDNGVAEKQDTPIVLGEDLFVISVDCTWSIRGLTAGEGPIHIGWCHGDLSVTEITEALDAEVSDPDDIIARERARRPVRRAGSFSGQTADDVMNDGNPVRTKCKFSVGDGHSLTAYAVNRSGAQLTTGGIVVIEGTIFGRWQR